MLPLIPLALQFLPSLVSALAGDKAGNTAQAVANAVQAATGATDPVQAAAVLKDPAIAAKLQTDLAQIALQRQAEQDAAAQAERAAFLADIQNARTQTTDLAKAGSAVQWAPAVLSFVVLATFGVVMWAALTRQLPSGSETILNMLLGTLAAMATSVVGYWVGSSRGSDVKTDLLYRSTPVK